LWPDAAAELAKNLDLLAEAVRGARRDWQKKNLQLVLHVKASSAKVVGSYYL